MNKVVDDYESLELNLLKELDSQLIDSLIERYKDILANTNLGKNTYHYSGNMFIIVYKDNQNTVLYGDTKRYIIINKRFDASVGSIIFTSNPYERIVVVPEAMMNLDPDYYRTYSFLLMPGNFTSGECKEYVLDKDEYMAKVKQLMEEEKVRMTKKEETKAADIDDESELFTRDSIYKNDNSWRNISVDKNIIEIPNGRYELDINLNRVFSTLSDLLRFTDRNLRCTGIVEHFIHSGAKSIIYTCKSTYAKQSCDSIDIKILPDKSTINGIKVKKNKIGMIVNNMKKHTEDEIKILDKMNVTKLNLLNIDTLEIADVNYNIPIIITAIDDNEFNVDIAGNTAVVEFRVLDNLLSLSPHNKESTKYVSYFVFRTLCMEYLHMTKDKMLETIRMYVLLNDI